MTAQVLRDAFQKADRKTMVAEIMLFLSASSPYQKRYGFYNLVGIIGVDATLKLMLAFGGRKLVVPKWSSLALCSNATAAMVDYLSGMSEEDVLKKWRKHRITKKVLDHLLKAFRSLVEAQGRNAAAAEEFIEEVPNDR